MLRPRQLCLVISAIAAVGLAIGVAPDGPAALAHVAPAHGTDSGGAHDHDARGATSHAGGEGHGGIDYNMPPLPGFAPGLGQLFVFSLILFGGFVLAARTLVWGPLIQALDAREARVAQAQAEAAAAQAEAERLHAAYEVRMAQTHEQVQGILAAARKAAEQEKNRIIAEADAQARALRDDAIRQIGAAREAALAEAGRSLEGQVTLAVNQIVGQRILS